MATLAKRKRTESFDNGVFFNIEAKRTPSMVSKLFSKRSEHIRLNKNYFRSEANTFHIKKTVFKAKRTDNKKVIFRSEANTLDRKKIILSEVNTLDRKKVIFEAKRTRPSVRNYFQSEANTLDRKKIIFEAKRTH
jgi:hypothetical protein